MMHSIHRMAIKRIQIKRALQDDPDALAEMRASNISMDELVSEIMGMDDKKASSVSPPNHRPAVQGVPITQDTPSYQRPAPLREGIRDILGGASRPMTRQEIGAALSDKGIQFKEGSLSNAAASLVKEGHVEELPGPKPRRLRLVTSRTSIPTPSDEGRRPQSETAVAEASRQDGIQDET